MSTTRIPPRLEPYVRTPPKGSLTLLTSVLGASANWLVLRFIYTALTTPHAAIDSNTTATKGDNNGGNEYTVLLTSFLRDKSFWVEGARRIGLDLGREERRGRWKFVDGLALGAEGVKREFGLGRASAAGEGGAGKVVLVVDAVDWLVVEHGNESGVEDWLAEVMSMPVCKYINTPIIPI
jgi:elongator complex protein 6